MWTKEVRVPVKPDKCDIPAFHFQAPCGDDLACLLTEYALTLQAQRGVVNALAACPWVSVGESKGKPSLTKTAQEAK